METAERAETLFHELDANPDGGITEEEFIRFSNSFLEIYNFFRIPEFIRFEIQFTIFLSQGLP